MTVSHPYVDKRTEHRRTPDWVVAVARGSVVDLHRFDSPAAAWRFFAEATVRGAEVGR